MVPIEILLQYSKIGFKLVPLDDLASCPVIVWSEIYYNKDFWSEAKLREHSDRFQNIATTFGKSHLQDSQGKELYLYCLDIDSGETLKRVADPLEGEWKLKTFVTKTQKDCGKIGMNITMKKRP
jgi:hypothetical protein